VQAAIRLIVNDIGSLPVDAFRRQTQGRKELRRPTWVEEPNPLNPNVTWEDHVKQVVFGLLTDGNAFVRVFPNVFNVQGIEVLDPTSVDAKPFRGNIVYTVKGEGDLSPAEIIHVPWMLLPGKSRGLNPIEAAKQGLGIALASDEFVGSYFGNGAVMSSWIKVPPGVDLTDAQIAQLKSAVRREHVGTRKSHAVGALTGGAELMPFDYNNRDAQLLELRDQIVEDVARLFGIPPHMLGSQKPGAVGYASVEQRSIDYVTHAILPIVKRVEVGYSRLLRGQQTYLKFNVNGLLRGDLQARAAFYSTMLESKVVRREEVREWEDLPFDPEGVGYLETPNNNAPEPPADEPQEPAA
jgi:HK97 family phage portal protein